MILVQTLPESVGQTLPAPNHRPQLPQHANSQRTLAPNNHLPPLRESPTAVG
ncbi:hypothetical protein T484DRAFT_1931660 [Baffinella frigidus]|nr:hypothetical protein T484DRAFT_1931660 [Cryptophyta sp. CCMP2293]